MKNKLMIFLTLFVLSFTISGIEPLSGQIRILVITGGHEYAQKEFNQMLSSFSPDISFQLAELPEAFQMFKPENRDKYDVLVFYHMWQKITEEQAKNLADCIRNGKSLVALHHSICAFDDWPEYWDIIGGKYFHKATTFKGKEFPQCSYKHDMHFKVSISDPSHPVTKGVKDFEIFDESYKGYYVEDGVKVLLTTDEPSSNSVIGWTKNYGKGRVVTLQSGHDIPTFENPEFRKILKQSVKWVSGK